MAMDWAAAQQELEMKQRADGMDAVSVWGPPIGRCAQTPPLPFFSSLNQEKQAEIQKKMEELEERMAKEKEEADRLLQQQRLVRDRDSKKRVALRLPLQPPLP